MNTPVWLDLELRKDIDDVLTLLYAIESGVNIKAVSINNPSINELKLLKGLFNHLSVSYPVFVTGVITDYPINEDITSVLFQYLSNEPVQYNILLNTTYDNVISGNYIFFCGGSLTTLSILSKLNPEIQAVVQGGYASYKIVPEYAVLKKFKKREKVPTWNLNLDIKATEDVLKSNIPVTFISKNICHSSFATAGDLKYNSFMSKIFNEYINKSEYKNKCLHDVLAFIYITKPDIIQFKNVSLHHTDDIIPKWWSEINEHSQHKISVDYNNDLFMKHIKSF